MNIETFGDIKERMKNIIIAKTDKLTDFNDGSLVSVICEAVARVLEKFYVDVRIGFDNNLKAVPQSVFNFTRKEGQRAGTLVVFSAGKAVKDDTRIPAGTRISDGTHIFETVQAAVIPAGKTESTPAAAQAEKAGLEYNVDEGALNSLVTSVAGNVSSVRNISKATGGSDTETAAEMTARFRTFYNGLQGTNVYGVKAGVLAVDGVRSVAVVEHEELKDGIYDYTVYVDDGTGGLSDDLKNKVETVVNGDGTQVNPGKRAAGVRCDVEAARSVPVHLDVQATVRRADTTVAQAEVKQSLEDYINGLTVGENVTITSLILICRRISYVTDVEIETSAGGGGEEAEKDGNGNIRLEAWQIARAGNVNVKIRSE